MFHQKITPLALGFRAKTAMAAWKSRIGQSLAFLVKIMVKSSRARKL
ncbi:hypothetical protein [Allofournierella massiliensis]